MINQGWAIARYDSRDGYGRHAREASYVAADAVSPATGLRLGTVASSAWGVLRQLLCGPTPLAPLRSTRGSPATAGPRR